MILVYGILGGVVGATLSYTLPGALFICRYGIVMEVATLLFAMTADSLTNMKAGILTAFSCGILIYGVGFRWFKGVQTEERIASSPHRKFGPFIIPPKGWIWGTVICGCVSLIISIMIIKWTTPILVSPAYWFAFVIALAVMYVAFRMSTPLHDLPRKNLWLLVSTKKAAGLPWWR